MSEPSPHDDGIDDTGPTASRRTVLQGAAVGIGTAGLGEFSALTAAIPDRGGPGRRFRVRVENVSTPNTLETSEGSRAVPLSPGAFAVHDSDAVLFEPGEAASDGIESLAEDGVPTRLASELTRQEGVSESGAFALDQTVADPTQPDSAPSPPIFPGGVYEFTVSGTPGDSLSLATMFVQSNDLFLAPGPGGIDLFEGNAPVDGDVTDQLALWDAGTEIDQEPGVGGDQAPRQSTRGTGASDDNSSTVRMVAAVNHEGYDYPSVSAVIRVTITPVETRPFRVRVENVSIPETLATADGGKPVPLSPGAYAVHGASRPLYSPGEPASAGIESLAEDGVPTALLGELGSTSFVHDAGAFAGPQTVADPNQPDGTPTPPIFPGGAYEFTVSAAPGDRLSLATMFVQSNDLFYAPGPDGIELFAEGEPVIGDVTDRITLWDAGTETDQEPGIGDDQAPRQSAPETGPADDNSSTVQPAASVNDEGYDYPPPSAVIRVTVTPVDPTPFQVRIENVSTPGFYAADASTDGDVWLTPGCYATHTGHNPILTPGDPATPGLAALAEAGRPGGTPEKRGLLTELEAAGNVTTSGAFTPADTVPDPNDPAGAVPGAPPIGPGGAYEFTIDGLPGETLSFASMFVPSNDLVFAPAGDGIPLFDGGDPVSGDVTDHIELLDAGTEPNQRPGFGVDQAPAQSHPDQGGDEGGVVRPIAQVDDGNSYPSVTEAIRVTLTPSPANRRLERTAVPAGGSIGVTVTVDLDEHHDMVAVFDRFDGPVSGSTVDGIRADGSSVPTDQVALIRTFDDGVVVAIEDLTASMTLELEYKVDVSATASPGSTVRFSGNEAGADVSADRTIDAELGTETATVSTGSVDAVARADVNGDGDITLSELRSAVANWSEGRYTLSELNQIVQAWASS